MPAELPTPTPRVNAESPLTGVLSFLKILQKHWGVVVACLVLGGAGALLYSKSVRRVYESASLIEMNPRQSQPLGDTTSSSFDLGLLFWDPVEYYQTQYKIISSSAVIKSAAEALSLQADAAFLGGVPESPTAGLDRAVGIIAGRLSVEPVKGSRLAYIKVTDYDPKRAKQICDAIANAYIEQNLEIAINSSSDAVVWLSGQLDHIKGDLERNENALYDFKEKNSLPSLSINEASNMLRLEMQEYDMALTHTRTRKQELLARESELAKVTPENPDAIPSSELLANAYLEGLRNQYRTASQQRQTLLAEGKGENHPSVKEASGRMADTGAAILREVANLQAAVEHDVAIIEKQESGEAALVEGARRAAVDLNMKEIEFHRLDRSRDENEKLYELLLKRMKEADLSRMMRTNNLRIVETAAIPGAPILPRVSSNVALGLLGGLLVGVFLAWLREQLDSSIKTPDDVEEKLGMVFLGLLPELNDDKKDNNHGRRRYGPRRNSTGVDGPPELTVHEHPLSGVSEAARSVRTNLTFMNPDRPYKRILVSSAAPSEGKTTVACSIAIAFAQAGQRVCIVDGDLRRPRLHRIFDRQGDSGLTNVLVGDQSLDEVAKPTIVPNLWSIPAGPLPPNPADILQSERFRQLINELAERFDRVIIDSPPLVPVTDGAILSMLVDGTVFVVRAFKTSRHVSAQGLRALVDVEAPVIGTVLNAVDLNKHEYAQYHYYYYKREGYRGIAVNPKGGMNDEDSSSAAPPN
jgi:capsular exopolysaccharide synthesis family protein